VLDLGCGFGWFCRWAREQGAAQVLGVDVSERMLARAAADTQDAAIAYTRADLESFEPAPASFDVVYSSLTFHYIADLERLLSSVYRSLHSGGSFVFSVEHPLYTAPADPRWSADLAGRKSWPINDYLYEGPRSTDWLAQGVIKQHRTLSTYINLLLRLGFVPRHVEEWGPTDEQIASRPELADERQRPTFLLVSARR
jgi:SAM-dependent methyltransferase